MEVISFKENKYTEWYNSIIKKARLKNRKKLKRDDVNFIYYENHHIYPRSFGGSFKKENMILLTPKEHFICHLLLTKMCINEEEKYKMLHAFCSMINCTENEYQKGFRFHKKTITSKIFENVRLNVANDMSKLHKGKIVSKISRKKMSDSAKKKEIIGIKGNGKGKDNREWKGYYLTPWGKFETGTEAVKKCPINNIRYDFVYRTCKNPDKIITIDSTRASKYVNKTHIGLTYGDLGFGFERIIK